MVFLEGRPAFGQPSASNAPIPATSESQQTASDGAASDASAESLMAQGIEFRRRREDRLALAAFERAWTLGAGPRALAQLALAEQALGHWREAHEHLQTALASADDPWIVSHRATLDVALNEIASRLGSVEISCNVEGAEVRVDGRVVGRTPLAEPIRVAAGNSVIQVFAQGYFDATRQAKVDAEALARVDFSLTPLVPAAAPTRGELETPPMAPPRVDAVHISPLASRLDAEHTSARDVLTYTSIGLAALGASVGVTGYVIREVNVQLYNDDARCSTVMGPPRSIECGDEFAAWRRGEVMAIAGSAAAGVFGLTALYLWWSKPEDRSEGTALSCGIGAGSIACGSAF